MRIPKIKQSRKKNRIFLTKMIKINIDIKNSQRMQEKNTFNRVSIKKKQIRKSLRSFDFSIFLNNNYILLLLSKKVNLLVSLNILIFPILQRIDDFLHFTHSQSNTLFGAPFALYDKILIPNNRQISIQTIQSL